MGEYITLKNGESYKLGTCEDLYYCTLERLATVLIPGATLEPGNLPPRDYLKPGWRYRFPFPDEDSANLHEVNHNRCVVWQCQEQAVKDAVANISHYTVYASISTQGADEHPYSPPSIGLACPQAPGWTGRLPSGPLLGISQQKGTIENGSPQLWTVVDCPYCGAKARLNPDEGATLAHEIERTKRRELFWLSIALRIRSGYLPGNLFERYGVHAPLTAPTISELFEQSLASAQPPTRPA